VRFVGARFGRDGADDRSTPACIARGVQSLREGNSTDGDEFMVELDADLAELQRKGH
jgi:hypothetical protein